MTCVAVFVDAGYLFAQGATALTGSKKGRQELKLNETAVVSELSSIAVIKSGSSRLLRIYWYDGGSGFRGGRMSLEHTALAHTDFIKLRLGQRNSAGQQKGVDSLIVTDLIELARNHAIEDALLLSGDEDVRIGVQIAQSYGVRVHLLGITPSRGSQSHDLLREADTTTEWDKTTIAKFLSHAPAAAPRVVPTSTPVAAHIAVPAPMPAPAAVEAQLEAVANGLFNSLDSQDKSAFEAFRKTQRGVPSDLDGKLLAQARTELGRSLDVAEKRKIRSLFVNMFSGTA